MCYIPVVHCWSVSEKSRKNFPAQTRNFLLKVKVSIVVYHHKTCQKSFEVSLISSSTHALKEQRCKIRGIRKQGSCFNFRINFQHTFRDTKILKFYLNQFKKSPYAQKDYYFVTINCLQSGNPSSRQYKNKKQSQHCKMEIKLKRSDEIVKNNYRK